MTQEGNILASLGINPIYLIGQIVNFTILLIVLKKFIYKPVLKVLDDRAKLISKGTKAAEESIQKEKEIAEEKEKIIQKTQQEMEKMIAQTKIEAETLKKEILEKAKAEAEKIIEKKEIEMQNLLRQQEQELQNKMADIAIGAAKKILENYLDSEMQKKIVESQMKKIAETKIF